MRPPSIRRDTLLILGLILMLALIVVTSNRGSQSIMRLILAKQAYSVADVWFRHLAAMPAEMERLVAGRGTSAALRDRTNALKHFTEIIRYEIFSPEGRLAYSSGQISEVHVTPLEAAFLVKEATDKKSFDERPVYFFRSEEAGKPKQYASVLLPLENRGLLIGSVLIYVDQTRLFRHLEASFSAIAFITFLAILAALFVPIVVIGFKIRDRWIAEKRIRFLAHNDPLTGLANRVTFGDKLTEALERNARSGEHIAVMFLDMDRFKEINDTFGHAAGDRLLVEFSKRLGACVRDIDIIARLSGDEFAVALLDVPDVKDIERPVARIFEEMSKPFDLDGHGVVCSVSIGIAVSPGDGSEIATLMRRADLALYRAKHAGRNTSAFYEQGMDAALKRRRLVENDIHKALAEDEFDLYFQPQIDLDSGAVTGSEALIRWNHPEKGVIGPDEFIGIAEDTGLIIPITEWCVKAACEAAGKWKKPLKVAVNLSASQFGRGGVVPMVERALADSGLDASRLEIEITETTLMSNTETVIDALSRLRKMGVSIAMDDFGTGYSSLSYLSKFKFDKVKIDSSFVKEVETDHIARAICSTIVALGNSLNMSVLAEGIETEAQADLMRELGCVQAQGYYYGSPLPADHLVHLIGGESEFFDHTSRNQKIA